jgi:hypothetical protein
VGDLILQLELTHQYPVDMVIERVIERLLVVVVVIKPTGLFQRFLEVLPIV